MAQQKTENRGDQADPKDELPRRPAFSVWILVGLVAGIACGVFFGDYCAPLQVVGDAFVGLLQMTVLPYIVISLIFKSNREFFDGVGQEVDALLISAESGSAFTLLYPEFEVVVSDGPRIALPLFYAIGAEDMEMRDFLEYWVTLRKKDGTMQHHYDHWILGRSPAAEEPRWSVIRNVLGWVQ